MKLGKHLKVINLLSLAALNFFHMSILAIFVTSFPLLQADFGVSNFELSLISTIYYSLSYFLQNIWINLAGKYSNGVVLIVGSLFWITPLLFIPFVTSYIQVLIIVGLIGIGAQSIVVVINNYFVSMEIKDNFAKTNSMLTIIQGAGGVFGTFFAASLQDMANLPWTTPFLYIFVLSLIFLIVNLVFLHLIHKKNISINFIQEKYVFNFKTIKRLLKMKINRLAIIIALLSIIPLTFLNIWTQVYFIHEHGVSQSIAMISFVFLSGAEFLGFLFGGYYFDYLKKNNKSNYRYFGFYGFSIAIVFFIIGLSIDWTLTHVPGDNFIELCINLFLAAIRDFRIALFYISFFLAYFSYTFIEPYIFAILFFENKDDDRKMMINLAHTVITLSYLIGPVVGGVIADAFGFTVMFFIVPMALFVSLIPLFLLGKSTGKQNGKNAV